MTTAAEVTNAMIKLHTRDHTMLGAMLIYLHANTNGPAERAAVLNNAIDAVFNLAMLICPNESREAVREHLASRILSLDVGAYPQSGQDSNKQVLNQLFRAGLKTMVEDPQLMTLVSAMSIAKDQPAVNDIFH